MIKRYKIDILVDGNESTIHVENLETNELKRGKTETYHSDSFRFVAEDIASMVSRLLKDLE